MVHNYGVESTLSRKGQCKIFAYKINSLKYFYNPDKHPEMVVLGVELLIRDFYDAVDKFLADIEKDSELRQRVENRLPKLFRISKNSQQNFG